MSEGENPPPPDGKGQLDREAAMWCVRLHGEDAERWRDEFEAWLRRGALHRGAYNRIEEVYLLGAKLRTTDNAQSPPPLAAPGPAPVGVRRAGRSWVAAMLVAGSVASLIVVARVIEREGPAPALADHAGRVELVAPVETSVRFRLADGSTITLGKNSVASVAFDRTSRTVSLKQGAGRFAVAHDGRSFAVVAGGVTVTARGTLFEVWNASGAQIRVRLIEGKVDVALPVSRDRRRPVGRRVVALAAGQGIVVDAPAATIAQRVAGVGQDFADQPRTVGELIDMANEGAGTGPRIVIEDRALRAIRLSGSFKVHDPETVADRLAAMLDLSVDRSTPARLVLRKRAPR